jgi:predicted nucleic acid-binding protein
VIVDTGVLFAAANRRDSNHSGCRLLVQTQPRLVVSALVVAEAAYLIGETLGASVETAFIRSLATDHYLVEGPTRSDLARMAELMAAYESLPLGATDAAVISPSVTETQ